MDVPLGVVFGIIAMFCWGAADFFAAKAVRRTSIFKTFVWSQVVGLILFIGIYSFIFNFPILSIATVCLILIASFFNVVGYLAFYRGLQLGKVSIISPVAASWVVLTVILSLIFFGETLTGFQAVGVILAISGAFLTSFKFHDLLSLKRENLAAGIEYALIALFTWGMHYLFIDTLVAELSWFLPIFFVKALIFFYLLVYSRATRKSISFPREVAFFMVMIGVLEAIAYLFYGAGVNSEYTAIVAPVAASFPIITIILARIFFKEVLEINQKIGIASVLTGLILLSM